MYKYINRTVLPAPPPGYPRHDPLEVAERGSIGLARPGAQGRAMDDKILKKLLKDHSACVRGGEEKDRRAVLIGIDLRSANLTNANLGGTEIWRCTFKD